MPQSHGGPRIYSEWARWWPLFSPPSHYVEEAADLLPDLKTATSPPPRTFLELGAGGGSLAFHFKPHFTLTLTDRSPGMLEQSRLVNPECEHIVGDMTSLRLGREFDIVFVHDAIMYATNASMVKATLRTAAGHCRKGGAVVVAPDHVRETYEPDSSMGGEDGPDGRGFRYLEWHWDPDPADDTCEVAYAFLMREGGTVTFESESHQVGMFSRASWIQWLEDEGFTTRTRVDPWKRHIFIGVKR